MYGCWRRIAVTALLVHYIKSVSRLLAISAMEVCKFDFKIKLLFQTGVVILLSEIVISLYIMRNVYKVWLSVDSFAYFQSAAGVL